MTNVLLWIGGVVCLGMAFIAFRLIDDSPAFLALFMILTIAGTGLLVLGALRALMAQFKVTGVAATLAASAIMVAQYQLARLVDPSGLAWFVSLLVAWAGGFTFMLAGVYWLKAIMAEKPSVER